MDPDAADVAMLYQDPHPAHRGFAAAVGADLVDFRGFAPARLGDSIPADVVNGLRYPRHDVYLVEGSRPLYAALVHRAVRGSRLVYLCADHGLYDLGRGDFAGDSLAKSLLGRFGAPAARLLGRQFVDGVVAVSDFAAEFTRPVVGPDAPIRVAHPYVQPETYDALGAVDPALDANVAVTVGRAARYKGVDLLVEAWPQVRERHPDAELHVVGTGHPDDYDQTEGVRLRGYVDALADAFGPASLFVQPSRMDTFPVSTLEAMRAGLPPLVTDRAGTRSEARAVDPGLVVEPTPGSLARGVAAYFDHPLGVRRRLAARARRRGDTFDAETRLPAFRAAFREVLEAI